MDFLEQLREKARSIPAKDTQDYFYQALDRFEKEYYRAAIIRGWIAVKNIIFARCKKSIGKQSPKQKHEFFEIECEMVEEKDNWENRLIELAREIDVLSDQEGDWLTELSNIKQKFGYAKVDGDNIKEPTDEETYFFLNNCLEWFLLKG